jgi:hypothetical protein
MSNVDSMGLSDSFRNLGKTMATSSVALLQETNSSEAVPVPKVDEPIHISTQPASSDKESDPKSKPESSLGHSLAKSLPTKPQEDNDIEALSNNKVDVEIEPDVKANVVKINMCSFVCSLNCLSRPAKND